MRSNWSASVVTETSDWHRLSLGNLRVSSNSSELLDAAGRGGPDLRRLWAMVTQVELGHSSSGEGQVDKLCMCYPLECVFNIVAHFAYSAVA